MEQILKVVAIGILACVLGISVKNENPTWTLLISIAAAVATLFFAFTMLSPIKDFIDELADAAGLSPAILAPLYKTLGIAIVTKAAAEACEDAKEKAFGIYIQIAGAVASLYVSLPLLSAVFRLIGSYLST